MFQFHAKFFSNVLPATLTAICHLDATVMCHLAFKSETMISEHANYAIVIQATESNTEVIIFGWLVMTAGPLTHLDSAWAAPTNYYYYYYIFIVYSCVDF